MMMSTGLLSPRRGNAKLSASFSERSHLHCNGRQVFISEWGTTNADGDGEPNSSATNEWTQFMDQNMIPNCNWSLRQQTSDVDQKSEKSAIFAGEKSLITAAALDAATFTSSGNIIKSYLTKNARSWADSLVKGKSGSCSFKATTAKQTDGKISGVLKSGCTYTSSNEKVASASGSDIVVGDYGFAILTGNDGSQSIVTVKQVAGQTITNLSDITCNFSGSCTAASKNGMSRDFDGDGTKDYLLTMDDKTNEGSKFTLTSLDPTTVSVSKNKCTNANCSNSQKNQQVWMLHFHKYGTAKVVASAPAITGFRAMQDTFEITYKKGSYNMNNRTMYTPTLREERSSVEPLSMEALTTTCPRMFLTSTVAAEFTPKIPRLRPKRVALALDAPRIGLFLIPGETQQQSQLVGHIPSYGPIAQTLNA